MSVSLRASFMYRTVWNHTDTVKMVKATTFVSAMKKHNCSRIRSRNFIFQDIWVTLLRYSMIQNPVSQTRLSMEWRPVPNSSGIWPSKSWSGIFNRNTRFSRLIKAAVDCTCRLSQEKNGKSVGQEVGVRPEVWCGSGGTYG